VLACNDRRTDYRSAKCGPQKKGSLAIFRLEDQGGSVSACLWPSLSKDRTELSPKRYRVGNGRLEVSDDGAVTVFLRNDDRTHSAEQQKAREMIISFPTITESAHFVRQLESCSSNPEAIVTFS